MIESPTCRRPTPQAVAIHEAGHVVVGFRLGLDIVEVDVQPDAQGGNGHSIFGPAKGAEDGPFVEKVITTFLAGSAAEAREAGSVNPESSGFDEEAIVRRWAARLGPPAAAEGRLGELRLEAERLVADPANWAAITRLARVLMSRRRLSGREATTAAELG